MITSAARTAVQNVLYTRCAQQPKLSTDSLACSIILNVSDSEIRALFSESDWAEITASIPPLPASNFSALDGLADIRTIDDLKGVINNTPTDLSDDPTQDWQRMVCKYLYEYVCLLPPQAEENLLVLTIPSYMFKYNRMPQDNPPESWYSLNI